MCQEPTELLWIGCLTGLISILIFKFDTMIPNINSQTIWPKVISHVTNNLLHLFNISHFSSACCSRNSSLISLPQTMAKRIQEQNGEERNVAKSKSTAMNLSSLVPTSSSSAKSLIASKSPGILTASGRPESRMRRYSKSDAASSSQARLQDAYFGRLLDTATVKRVATKEESGNVDFSEPSTGSEEDVTREAGCASCKNQPAREVQKLKTYKSHNLNVSPAKFILRKQYSRSSGGSTDENMTTLGMFCTWIWLFLAYFWMPLFEQQFILDKTVRRIYDTWRIICGTVSDCYSMKLKNWSANNKKSLV